MAIDVGAIVTVPPYAPFLDAVAAHPLVRGLRLNTVMPLRREPGEMERVLARLAATGKTVHIDLKGRQLRVVSAAVPPFTEVRVSHRLRVRTPAVAFFADGRERARVLAVDGDRLILEDGPRRFVGPGESVNIPCPSLRIEGTLTDTDRAYVAAAGAAGLHDFMLSFAEREADVAEVEALDPRARVTLKVESAAGLDLARRAGASLGRLMAARGDLYVELARPHRLAAALREIVARDPEAIVASRLFPTLAFAAAPAAQDVTDAAYLLEIGYRTFMLGDEVCLRPESALAALNLLEAIAADAPGPGARRLETAAAAAAGAAGA